mgnify:CR=1 FL=1
MATYEQLGRALKNADAAGDVDAARTLAKAIRDGYYDNGSTDDAYSALFANAPEEDTSLLGYIPETFKAIGAGATGMVESALTGASFLLPEEQEQAARKKIAEVGGGVQEFFAPDAGYEGTYLDLMRGLGSTVPFLATPFLGAAGLATGVGLGAAAGSGEAAQRAVAAGATEDQISKAAGLGILPGLGETLVPFAVGKTLRAGLAARGIGKAVGEEVATTTLARLRRIGLAAGGEGLQEASAEVAQNLIAQGIYDPETGTFTGTKESLGIGAGVGGIIAALVELATPGRPRGRPQGGPTPETPEVVEPEVVEPIETAPTEGDLFGRTDSSTVISAEDIEMLGLSLDIKTAEKVFGLDLAIPEQREEARTILTEYRNRKPVQNSKPEVVVSIDEFLARPAFNPPETPETVAQEPRAEVPPEQITIDEAIEQDIAAEQEEQGIQEAELTTVQERITDTRQKESEQRRREVLLPIIDRGDIADAENLSRAFSAELGRQGFTDTTPTESELGVINRALGVTEAFDTQQRQQEEDLQQQEQARQQQEETDRAGAAEISQFIPERVTPAPEVATVEVPIQDTTNRERLDRTGRTPQTGDSGQLEIPAVERPEQAIRRLDIPEGAVVSPLEEGVDPAEDIAEDTTEDIAEDTTEDIAEAREDFTQQYQLFQSKIFNPDGSVRRAPAKKPIDTTKLEDLKRFPITKDNKYTPHGAIATYLQGVSNDPEAEGYLLPVENATQLMDVIAFESVKAKAEGTNDKNSLRRAKYAKTWFKKYMPEELPTLNAKIKAAERREETRVAKDIGRETPKAEAKANKEIVDSILEPNKKDDKLTEDLANEIAAARDVEAGRVDTPTDAEQRDVDKRPIREQLAAGVEVGDVLDFLTKDAIATSMGNVSAKINDLLLDNNLKGALNELIATTPNNDVKVVARKLAAALKDVTVEFVDGGLINQVGHTAVGAYDHKTKTMFLDVNVDTATHTLLHETAHAVVTDIITTNPSAALTKGLETIFKQVRGRISAEYGSLNLMEFVVEAFTNPEFQAKLAAFKPTGQKLTGWRKFVNAIGKFLGLIKDPASVKDVTLNYIDMLLAPEIDERLVTQVNQSLSDNNSQKALNLMFGGKGMVSDKTLNESIRKVAINSGSFTAKQSVNLLNGVGLQAIVDLAKTGPKAFGTAVDGVQEIIYRIDGIRNNEINTFTGILNDARKAFRINDKWYDRREDTNAIDEANEIVAEMTTNGVDATVKETEETYSKFKITYGTKSQDGSDLQQNTIVFNTQKEADAQEKALIARSVANVAAKKGPILVRAPKRESPDPDTTAKYKEVRARFAKLSPTQRGAIVKIRDEYLRMDKNIRKAEDANIDKLEDAEVSRTVKEILFRKRLEAGRIEPYFKLNREGEYWLEFNYIDDNGATQYHASPHDSKGDRAIAMERLERQEGVSQGSTQPGIILGSIKASNLSDVKNTLLNTSVPLQWVITLQKDFNELKTKLRQSMPENATEEQKKALKTQTNLIDEMFADTVLRSLPEQSLIQAKKARKNIHGFEGDFIGAYEKTMPKFITSYANIKHRVDMYLAAEKVREERDKNFRDDKEEGFMWQLATAVAGTPEETNRQAGGLPSYVEFSKNPYLPEWVRKARALTFMATLGANISSVAVNVSIVPIVLQSRLSGEYGGLKATRATSYASSLFAQTYGTVLRDGVIDVDADGQPLSEEQFKRENGGFSLTNELSGETAFLSKVAGPLIKRLKDLGMDTRTIAAETSQLDNPTSPWMNKFSYWSGFLFNHSERGIRQISALSTYVLEMESKTGKEFKDITDAEVTEYGEQAAKKATDVTLWVNASALLTTAPRFGQKALGGVGSLVMQFKAVPAQFFYTQLRMIKALYTSTLSTAKTEAQREEARLLRNTFLWQAGSGAVLLGAKGIPMYGVVSVIANLFLDDDEDDFNTIVTKQVGNGFYYGALATYADIDLTDRIALTNLMVRDRGNYVPDSEFEYYFESFAGPFVGVSTRIAGGGYDLLFDGDPTNNDRALERMMPSAISNALKGSRFLKEGYRTGRDDAIVAEIGLGDAIVQGLGFAPASVRLARDKLSRNMRVDRGIGSRRSKLLSQMALAIKKGDSVLIDELRESIQEYNQEHPASPILSKNIEQSLRTRARNSLMASMTGGAITDRRLMQEILDSNEAMGVFD